VVSGAALVRGGRATGRDGAGEGLAGHVRERGPAGSTKRSPGPLRWPRCSPEGLTASTRVGPFCLPASTRVVTALYAGLARPNPRPGQRRANPTSDRAQPGLISPQAKSRYRGPPPGGGSGAGHLWNMETLRHRSCRPWGVWGEHPPSGPPGWRPLTTGVRPGRASSARFRPGVPYSAGPIPRTTRSEAKIGHAYSGAGRRAGPPTYQSGPPGIVGRRCCRVRAPPRRQERLANAWRTTPSSELLSFPSPCDYCSRSTMLLPSHGLPTFNLTCICQIERGLPNAKASVERRGEQGTHTVFEPLECELGWKSLFKHNQDEEDDDYEDDGTR